MRVQISRDAGRQLRRSNKRLLLLQKIEELAADPSGFAANVIRLKGSFGSRLRVQDWRILYRVEDGVLFIDEIEPRGSAYEDRT